MFGKKDNKSKSTNGNGNGAGSDFEKDHQPRLDKMPKNISETKAWKASSKGMGKMWSNYVNILGTSFSRMSRGDQEALITRASIICSMGVTALMLALFYPFIPSIIRIFLVPVALVFAWWAGKNLISAVVIGRLEGKLNKES